jgi:hypothetical protein
MIRLLKARGRVDTHSAAEIHRRFLLLIEDPDLCGVANTEKVSLNRDGVADVQSSDVALGQGCG